MRPEVKAAWIAVGANLAMYAWWIWADALLSDDYYLFATAPSFKSAETDMFRPLAAATGDMLATFVQSSAGAIYWAKALLVLLSSAFAGLLAASFARVTGSVGAGVAVALLVSTTPGIQINSIWLITAINWLAYVVPVAIFLALLAWRDRPAIWRWVMVALFSVVMALMLLTYQLAAFILAGLAAAYIVLSTDDRKTVVRTVVPLIVIAGVAMAAYLLALGIAISSGYVGGGRAGGALSGLLARLLSGQAERGLHWFNLFVTAKQSAAAALLFITAGASIDIWRNGAERALRWGAAILITAGALYVPAALNPFPNPGRLYSAGAIGAAGLVVASALALFRELPASSRGIARIAALVLGFALGISSLAAGVVGIGLTKHAELQYIRNQIARQNIAEVWRVHLIPPPESPFWSQPIRDPADDMYVFRLCTYHVWAREGIVRFALRYADPARRIQVTIGPDAPEEKAGIAIVDMRPADRALFQIPY